MGRLSNHYEEVVIPTWNAAGRSETEKDHFLNAALGLVGEAGEVADCHKKHFYHKPKDYRESVLLEMGDVMYYWLKLNNLWGFTVKEVLQANREKLFNRYEIK